jgi:hypothetical protein
MQLYRALLVVLILALNACSTRYVTPGKAVDFSQIHDSSIEEALKTRPTLTFPAAMVAVRVQGAGYANEALIGYGNGNYTVLNTREVGEDQSLSKIESLPGLEEAGTLNQLLIPQTLSSDLQLRQGAARLHADLLLLYTFSTQFTDKDLLPPLSIITLGLSPTQRYTVTSTASAVVLDVKTGFVYAALEETQSETGLATSWNTSESMDEGRKTAEKVAFEKLVGSLETAWGRIYERYKQKS